MNDLFGNVFTETPAVPFANNRPRASEVWLVATWYAVDGRWKLWRDEWRNREAAQRDAEQTLQRVRGHTYYCLLRVTLPGEQTL